MNSKYSNYFLYRNGFFTCILKYKYKKLHLFKTLERGQLNDNWIIEQIKNVEVSKMSRSTASLNHLLKCNESYRIPSYFDMRKKDTWSDLLFLIKQYNTFDCLQQVYYYPLTTHHFSKEIRDIWKRHYYKNNK